MTAVPAAVTPPALVHAAGAVVWRVSGERLEVALVHRPRYKDWSWPKGKLDPGESVAAAAVREVAEEIGSQVVLGVPLPVIRYRTPDGGAKQVRYWAAREAGPGDAPALAARPPVARAELAEIDDVVWVSAATAHDMLTRPTDRRPLAVVTDLWARGRLATRVVAVARHGQARPRARWRGDEGARPLTPQGHAQAAALVPVLAAFGVREVSTSPWERCRATVAPYAAEAGLPLDTVEALTEAAYRTDPGKAAGVLADHLGDPRDAVIATHRPVLPAVVDMIADSTRRWTLGTIPDKDPFLRTGEVLVAHVAGRGTGSRVVAVEHHRPMRQPNAV